MYRRLLQSILNRAATEEMLFGWDEVSEWPNGTRDLVLALRLLRLASPASTMDCSDCDRGCIAAPVTIVERPDDTRQAFLECAEYVRVEIPVDHLSRWQVDMDGLTARLAGELGGEPEELIPGRLWLIGRPDIGGVRTDVLLARGIEWQDGERVLREARNRKRSQAAVVLVPALAGTDAASEESLEIIRLDDVLSLGADWLSVDVSAIREAVGRSQTSSSGIVASDEKPFRHSSDFRSVNLRGREFSLTTSQASVVQCLWENYENQTPDVSQAHLLENVLDSTQNRLKDVFKNSPALGELIVAGGSRGTFRLNI